MEKKTTNIMEINDIVALVKLASLLFAGTIMLQCFFAKASVQNNKLYEECSIIGIGFFIFLLLFIYVIWSFSTSKRHLTKTKNNIQIIENIIFMSIFFIVILISGGNTSQYKVLFLFIITTTTIQSGMKRGIITALISSLIILGIDIMAMPKAEVNIYFENDLILCGVFILTAWPLGYYVKLANKSINKLTSLANEDGLTGLYNHRYFYDALINSIKEVDKEKCKLSVIFLDIDYFKQYNDLYGHQEGDNILREIGNILSEYKKLNFIPARYGGEEFAVIMPFTDEKKATDIAESIRKKIEKKYFKGQENQPNGNLTASIGISVYPDRAANEVELIKSADDALYKAKFFNKNRVETYTSILDEIKGDIDEKDIELVTSIKTLISVINAKDRYTYGHSERVVFYSKILGEALNLTEDEKRELKYGAYMHDIGKINIPKEILIKKMPLNDKEWNMLKEHPQNGVDIIEPVKSLSRVKPIILYHHEKFDGTGYPEGLKGNEIPYLARILTVVDSFDAMTSNRPYNKRKTYSEGIEELRKWSGKQFDPKIVDAFIKTLKENVDELNSLR